MSDNQLAIAQAPMFGLSTLEEAVNFAGQMAKANLLPAHLKGSPADCLRVVMQAARWQMDPFSVADKTSVISGKLMYEGQLVSAVVNARGNLSKRLDYQFEGEGDKRVLTVSGTLKGEQEPREITLDVIMARRINKNGQMNQNPDQQMCYIGARMWARRHTSELMLGVYTPDEIDPDQPEGEQANVTPVAERPQPKERAKRGAAGAKAAEVVVTQEQQAAAEPAKAAPAPTPEPDIQKQMEARQAKTEAPATPEPKPADGEKVAPRAFLHDGEKITVTAKVETLEAVVNTANGQRIPAVKALLSGGFNADVRHKEGGAKFIIVAGEEKGVEALPPWKVGATLSFVLYGKKSVAAASNGKVLVFVESVASIPEQGEAMEQHEYHENIS